MIIIKPVVTLFLVVCVVFFLLGLKSQKAAKREVTGDRLPECGNAPNCVSSEPDTQPEKLVPPLSGTLDAVKAAIISTGGTIVSESSHFISATYMSRVFKFVDDVDVRDAGQGVVHIRSGSRVGYSDRGVNRKRVEAIRSALANAA